MKENIRTILKDLAEFQREHFAWTYIDLYSGEAYCYSITYTIEEDEEQEGALDVCSYLDSNPEMASYLQKMGASSDERTLASYMWANHQALCKEYHNGYMTLEDKCGILSAIQCQLYAIRRLSPTYYKDNLGFSEAYKSLRNYNYVRKRLQATTDLLRRNMY